MSPFNVIWNNQSTNPGEIQQMKHFNEHGGILYKYSPSRKGN